MRPLMVATSSTSPRTWSNAGSGTRAEASVIREDPRDTFVRLQERDCLVELVERLATVELTAVSALSAEGRVGLEPLDRSADDERGDGPGHGESQYDGRSSTGAA